VNDIPTQQPVGKWYSTDDGHWCSVGCPLVYDVSEFYPRWFPSCDHHNEFECNFIRSRLADLTHVGWVGVYPNEGGEGAFDEIATCHQSLCVKGPNSWVGTHKIMDVWEVFGSIGGNFVEFLVKDAIHSIYETHTHTSQTQTTSFIIIINIICRYVFWTPHATYIYINVYKFH